MERVAIYINNKRYRVSSANELCHIMADTDAPTTCRVYFENPAYGTWDKSFLDLPYGTMWTINNNTITFTLPNTTEETNTVKAAESKECVLSFIDTDFDDWDNTNQVTVYDYSYTTPTIYGDTNNNNIITKSCVFTATNSRTAITFTNELSDEPTDESKSGSHTWTISGTDINNEVFTRTFEATENTDDYYYTISRNSSATHVTDNMEFNPIVQQKGHTYWVYYKKDESIFGNLPNNQFTAYPNTIILGTNETEKVSITELGYTVTFMNPDNTIMTREAAINTISYSANGWIDNSGNIYENSSEVGYLTSDLVLKPNFSEEVTRGSITLPILVSSDKYFNGWATSLDATVGLWGGYTPTDNITLYPTWKSKDSLTTQDE